MKMLNIIIIFSKQLKDMTIDNTLPLWTILMSIAGPFIFLVWRAVVTYFEHNKHKEEIEKLKQSHREQKEEFTEMKGRIYGEIKRIDENFGKFRESLGEIKGMLIAYHERGK